MFFFYLVLIAKTKFKECQPQVQQFCSVYYLNYPMTLYFQVQFLKLKCTDNAKSTIKNALKNERKKKVSSLKYLQGPEKKCTELKRDIIEIHRSTVK